MSIAIIPNATMTFLLFGFVIVTNVDMALTNQTIASADSHTVYNASMLSSSGIVVPNAPMENYQYIKAVRLTDEQRLVNFNTHHHPP